MKKETPKISPLPPHKEAVVVDESKFDEFKLLYKRFVDGTRWINKQMQKLEEDKRIFQETVIKPMDELWNTFTDEEKKYWDAVALAVKTFNGRIV